MGITTFGPPKRARTHSIPEAGGNIRLTVLSPREREVLALIAAGMTDRQIADELIVSRVTISTHVAHILDKLGVPNRTAAVAVASGAVRIAGTAD